MMSGELKVVAGSGYLMAGYGAGDFGGNFLISILAFSIYKFLKVGGVGGLLRFFAG